jgi:multidrug efflux pump subunit AcrA (membrane-fusion protein)
MTAPPSPTHRRRRFSRKALVGTIAAVAVIAAGSSAWALTAGGGSASYRIATVGRDDVVQSLTTTGVISPMQSADLDFQVAGKVGKVLVKVGQHVHSGQPVARLDRAALRAAVASARAALSDARATLSTDETSQTSTTSTRSTTSPGTGKTAAPTSGGATPTPTPTSTSHHPSAGAGAAASRIARDQATVLAAQRRTDGDLTMARAALKAATSACAAELHPSSTAQTAGSASSSDPTACTEATTTLLADQTTVATDQDAVAKAEAALDRDVTAAATTATASVTTDTATTSTTTAKSVTVVATTTPTATSATTTTPTQSSVAGGAITASHLAADQATIDTDRAKVATAVADLGQAELSSPLTGRVRVVTIHNGDSVSGASSATAPAVEVVGSAQSKVTIDLSAAQVRLLSVGMTAHVIPDGAQTAVVGHVSSIGVTASSTDTSSATYPVQIALAAHVTALVSGADAAVTVDLATAHHVIAVPTSTVHRAGATSYVRVLRGGQPVRVTVKTGAMGAGLTQIRSGLAIGQRVVLAALDAAVPSSSTNLPTGRSRLQGGFSLSGGSGAAPTGAGPGGGPPQAGG